MRSLRSEIRSRPAKTPGFLAAAKPTLRSCVVSRSGAEILTLCEPEHMHRPLAEIAPCAWLLRASSELARNMRFCTDDRVGRSLPAKATRLCCVFTYRASRMRPVCTRSRRSPCGYWRRVARSNRPVRPRGTRDQKRLRTRLPAIRLRSALGPATAPAPRARRSAREPRPLPRVPACPGFYSKPLDNKIPSLGRARNRL